MRKSAIFLSLMLVYSLVLGQSNIPRSDMWVTDGKVYSVLRNGNTLFVGGDFNYVGTSTGHGAILSVSSGDLDQTFPVVNGNVYAVVSDGQGGWYIGGDFTEVGGLAVQRLARIKADKTVDQNWIPEVDRTVYALAFNRANNTLYIGGAFGRIGAQNRNRLASIRVANNNTNATDWTPDPDGTVFALAYESNRLYVGGAFSNVAASNRGRGAAFNTNNNAILAWDPAADGGNIEAIALAAGRVYIGGDFTAVKGNTTRANLAALTTGGAGAIITAWDAQANGPVNTIVATRTGVFVGGLFSRCGRQPMRNLAQLNTTNGGAITAFNPNPNGEVFAIHVDTLVASNRFVYVGGAFSQIGGQTRNNFASLNQTTGAATPQSLNANNAVYALAPSDNNARLYFGGAFTSAGGQAIRSLAAITTTTGQAQDWNPGVDGIVRTLAIRQGLLYFGGEFTLVGGQSRTNLAAVSLANAQVATFNPLANGRVNSIYISPNGILYAGGEFTSIAGGGAGGSGQPRRYLAAINLANNTVNMSWSPEPDGFIHAIHSDGRAIYIGGAFQNVGGQQRRRLASLDLTTGNAITTWNPNLNNTVHALAFRGTDTLFVGGAFTQVDGGTTARQRIAAYNTRTGALLPFNPPATGGTVQALAVGFDGTDTVLYVGGLFTSVRNQPRLGLASVRLRDANLRPFNPEAQDPTEVYALHFANNRLYAGGAFQTIGTSPRGGIAEFDINCLPMTLNITGAGRAICPGGSITLVASITGGTGPYRYSWSPTAGLTGAASANPTATPSRSTTYTLLVTDANGCNIAANVAISVVTPQPISFGNNLREFNVCENADSARIVVDAGPGARYSWAPAAGLSNVNIANPTAKPARTTIYTVTATSAIDGCASTATVTVNINLLPGANAGNVISYCAGEPGVPLQASGGSSYVWNPTAGLSDPNISNPRANPAATTIYTVTVTGANGCTANATVRVEVRDVPRPSVSAGAPEICLGEMTQLTATAPPNTVAGYEWRSTAGGGLPPTAITNTVTVKPTQTATYTLTAIGINSCRKDTTIRVVVKPLPVITIRRGQEVISGTDVRMCRNDGVTLTASGGDQYLWEPSLGIQGPNNRPTVTLNPVQDTTYTVTVIGTNNCQSKRNIRVIVIPYPVTDAGNDTTICEGQVVRLIGQAGLEPSPKTNLTYLWLGGDASIFLANDRTLPNPQVRPRVTTTFTLRVLNFDCERVDSVRIRVNPAPPANAGPDANICANAGRRLFGSGGITYNWAPVRGLLNPLTGLTDNAATLAEPFAQPASNVTYVLTVTDANGCTATDAVNVTVYDLPNADISPAAKTICPGESLTLNGTGGIACSWACDGCNLNTEQANLCAITVAPMRTTKYRLTVTSPLGCSNVDSITVVVANAPRPRVYSGGAGSGNQVRNVVICQGKSTQLSTDASVVFRYQWLRNGVAIGSATGSNHTITRAGIYSVVVENQNCPQESEPVTVVEQPNPQADAGLDKPLCQGDVAGVTLTATGGVSCSWAPIGSITPANACQVRAFPDVTTRYVVTVTDANGCTNTDDVTVFVYRAPEVTVSAEGPTTYCEGKTTLLRATVGPGYTYQWKRNNTPIEGARAFSYPVSQSGRYTVDVFVPGCSSITSAGIDVNVRPAPPADAGLNQTVCAGSGTRLNGSGAGQNGTYLWAPATSLTDPTSPTTQAFPSSTTVYTLTVTDRNGCTAKDEVRVVVTLNTNLPNPTISLDGSPILCPGQRVVLLTPPGEGYTYQWRRNGQDIPNAIGQSLTVDQAGIYQVQVASRTCQPSTSGEVFIQLRNSPFTTLFVSDGTSPNQDSLNCKDGFIEITTSGGTPPYRYSLDGINYFTATKVTDLGPGNYTLFIQDSAGCLITRSFRLKCFTTINSRVSKAATFSAEVYPNPSNGILNLRFSGITVPVVTVTMTDITGRKVLDNRKLFVSQRSDFPLDVTGLTKGMYLLTIDDERGYALTQKVVIE